MANTAHCLAARQPGLSPCSGADSLSLQAYGILVPRCLQKKSLLVGRRGSGLPRGFLSFNESLLRLEAAHKRPERRRIAYLGCGLHEFGVLGCGVHILRGQ